MVIPETYVKGDQPFIDLGSVNLIEIPYKIGGLDYILKEASGDAVCVYRNASFRETELGPDGKPSKIGNMADIEPLLVSLCLFNDQGRRVDVNQLRKWPNRILKPLFEKVKEISEMGEESQERDQLEDALDHPNAPCRFSDLQNYIKRLPGNSYDAIKVWIGDEAEETAKNEPSDMEDGSS